MKPPGGTRERERRDPAATRQALLHAGAELFAQRGFDGVSTEEVAQRAGVNKALISYHFRGKRGLYVAILQSTFTSMADKLKAIEASAPGARAALHGFLEAFQQIARERPGFPTLFLREVLSAGIEPVLLPHLLEIIGVSRRLAERGAREGLFRRVDPLLLHFGLVGSLVFFFATEPARRRAAAEGRVPFVVPDRRAFVRYLEELTLRGLAPGTPSSRTPGLAPGRRPPPRKGARA
jgi:TetR/AcrR family transcriptional regulator